MAISALIALFFALWNITAIGLAPPKLHPRHLQIGTAATHVLLDAPDSMVVNPTEVDTDFPVFTRRATLYGNVIATPPLLERIGRRIGVPADQIAAVTRLTTSVDRTMREPDSEQRANQLLISHEPYRLDIQPDPDVPIIHIYAQAPSAPAAKRLADATVSSLDDYVREAADADGVGARGRVSFIQLGHARGAVINSKTKPLVLGLTFLIVFGVSLGLLLGAAAVRRQFVAAGAASGPDVYRRRLGAPRRPSAHASPNPKAPRPESPLTRRRWVSKLIGAGGDWPRTTRVLPWMIAGFMVMLWLVPFNVIQLTASLPFDLKFDRLVLPIVFVTWILSLATGGPAAPRPRMTLIHLGVGMLVAVSCIGIVVNARYLNQTLELQLPVKKLTLLFSYGLFFVIVASSVRSGEVRAFLKFTLGLAVLCAIGVIWEYRFRYNVFHSVSDMVLPGFFQVGSVDSNEVDDIGRRMTRGPAEHPLETVAMLSMAIPIAIVGIIHGKDRRERILHGVGACLLLAAAISTYRKSALLAPIAGILTIAYFRRRDLLRLAPLGVISLGVMHALAPGALGSILFQLHPTRLGASTVSDRSADYDAVRPDLWSHLLFGRGYGSYDHVSYRILDSEVLSRLVDTGVLGLCALVFMAVSIVFAARGPIRSRHSELAPPALAVAAAAVSFLVLAFLFDVTSFPHTPYILLSLAGLLAVMVRTDGRAADDERPGVDHLDFPAPRPPYPVRESDAHPRPLITR